MFSCLLRKLSRGQERKERNLEKKILYIGEYFDMLPMFTSEREGGRGVFYVCSGLLKMKDEDFFGGGGWFDIDTISKSFQICIVEIVLEFKRKTVLNSIVFSLYEGAWCA